MQLPLQYVGQLLNWREYHHANKVFMSPCIWCRRRTMLLDDNRQPSCKLCAEHHMGFHAEAADPYCPTCNPNWRSR